MNNKRRKTLKALIYQLEECVSFLQSLLDEEQDSYDNMPEQLQYSNNGYNIENAIDVMENSCEQISEATESLKGL